MGKVQSNTTRELQGLCLTVLYPYYVPNGSSVSRFTHQREIKKINIIKLRFLSRGPQFPGF